MSLSSLFFNHGRRGNKNRHGTAYFFLSLIMFLFFSHLSNLQKQGRDTRVGEGGQGEAKQQYYGHDHAAIRNNDDMDTVSDSDKDRVTLKDYDVSSSTDRKGSYYFDDDDDYYYDVEYEEFLFNAEVEPPLGTTVDNDQIQGFQDSSNFRFQRRSCTGISPKQAICTDYNTNGDVMKQEVMNLNTQTSSGQDLEEIQQLHKSLLQQRQQIQRMQQNQNIHDNNANEKSTTTIRIPKEIIENSPNAKIHIQFNYNGGSSNGSGSNNVNVGLDGHVVQTPQLIFSNKKVENDIQHRLINSNGGNEFQVKFSLNGNSKNIENRLPPNTPDQGSVPLVDLRSITTFEQTPSSLSSPLSSITSDERSTSTTTTKPQQFNKGDNNIATNNSDNPTSQIRYPRYFKHQNLSKSRIKKETEYFLSNGKKWSQRVILEILYHQILGIELDEHEVSFSLEHDVLDLGAVDHPNTKSPIVFQTDTTMRLQSWMDDAQHVCEWASVHCASTPKTSKDARYNYDTVLKERRNSTMYKNEGVDIAFDYVGDECFCVDPEMPLLSQFYDEDVIAQITKSRYGDDDHDYENKCQCIDGSVVTNVPPKEAVTEIILNRFWLVGGAIPADLANLPFLKKLVIKDSSFIGLLPIEFGYFQNLNELHLENVDLIGGEIIPTLGMLNRTLENLTIKNCNLEGTIPKTLARLTNLKRLDLSANKLQNDFHKDMAMLKKLEMLDLSQNQLTGVIAPTIGKLTNLKVLNLAENKFTGAISEELYKLQSLVSVNLEKNLFHGTFEDDLDALRDLRVLKLGQNEFKGMLPQGGWDGFEKIDFHDNMMTGSIPEGIITTTLRELNLADNFLIGTVPVLDQASNLKALMLQANYLEGDVSIFDVLTNVQLRVQKNKFIGRIDQNVCLALRNLSNYDVPFNCTDFIACPSGTFHPEGAANEISGCMKCPRCSVTPTPSECLMVGQTNCSGSNGFVRGDMNGDGSLSQRETLRLIYVLTGGKLWGEHYSDWQSMNIDQCTLPGINCKGGKVTKIDLRGATLCATQPCNGIPNEIENLGDSLEILDLNGSFSPSFSLDIPSSIRKLTKLKVLDLSKNRVKSIPDDIGLMYSLQILKLKDCRYIGHLPSLWKLDKLEKLDISENDFLGAQFPSEFGKLTNLRELLISRCNIKGPIPADLGALTHLKNLEFNGNNITGTIPSSFENLKSLKRLDINGNNLEGPIDFVAKIPHFEVVHMRSNRFSGTIPSDIGKLQKLLWLDLTENYFTGEVPYALSEIPTLKDLFLGGNYLNGPIPEELCKKPAVNGVKFQGESCDHILCPTGTYSKEGYAEPLKGIKCQPCDEKAITIHLGMTNCVEMSHFEYMSMLEALVYEKEWHYQDAINKEGEQNECHLDLVNCDEEGNIISLEIPLSGISIDDELFR